MMSKWETGWVLITGQWYTYIYTYYIHVLYVIIWYQWWYYNNDIHIYIYIPITFLKWLWRNKNQHQLDESFHLVKHEGFWAHGIMIFNGVFWPQVKQKELCELGKMPRLPGKLLKSKDPPIFWNGFFYPPLKLTASSHLEMDGWNMMKSPFGAKGIFLGTKWLLVSGSVVTPPPPPKFLRNGWISLKKWMVAFFEKVTNRLFQDGKFVSIYLENIGKYNFFWQRGGWF